MTLLGVILTPLHKVDKYRSSVLVMDRIMLDTNALSYIAEENLMQKIKELASNGIIEILVTHAQMDEVDATPDVEKAKKMLEIPAKIIPTDGFILDVSRLGQAKFCDENDRIEELRANSRKPNPSRDALIGITAIKNLDFFVTDDKKLRRRITKIGFSNKLLSFHNFKKRYNL